MKSKSNPTPATTTDELKAAVSEARAAADALKAEAEALPALMDAAIKATNLELLKDLGMRRAELPAEIVVGEMKFQMARKAFYDATFQQSKSEWKAANGELMVLIAQHDAIKAERVNKGNQAASLKAAEDWAFNNSVACTRELEKLEQQLSRLNR